MKSVTGLFVALLSNTAVASPLVLYTNDFEDIIGDRFTADTGHEIEVVQMSGGNLLARIAAESNNPNWDVLLFDGVGSLHSLDQQGILKRGLSADNEQYLTEQGRSLVPESRAWMPVGTTASCVLAYRTDMVSDQPIGFNDLTDSQYHGMVVKMWW